jgi:Tripartite tricarboxylate transporter TctB family.
LFKKDDWMFGVIAIVVGVVALFAVSELAGVKTMDPAGPVAMPRIVSWMMIAIGVMHVIGSILAIKNGAPEKEKKKKNNLPVVLICIAGFLYYLLLERVGYLIMTPLLILAIMTSVGERNVKKIAFTCIGAVAVLFGMFHYGLGVSMPLGVLSPLFN